MITFGTLSLDPVEQRMVGPSGHEHLPLKQALLLEALMKRAGQVVTHDRLIRCLYPDPMDEPRDALANVRTRMSWLRDKIQSVGSDAEITSLNKAGYRIE